MQKLVIDTNVIVSALISRQGIPAKIIDELVLEDKVTVCLSVDILQEYIDVLNRNKFLKIRHFKQNAVIFLSYLDEFADYFETDEKVNILSDADDNKFLDLAAAAKADYIITGNTNDFNIQEFKGTKIVTPSDYWNKSMFKN